MYDVRQGAPWSELRSNPGISDHPQWNWYVRTCSSCCCLLFTAYRVYAIANILLFVACVPAFFDIATVDINIESTPLSEIQRVANNPQPQNTPEGFVVEMTSMIPNMGSHALNPLHFPSSAVEWFDPVWIMSPYNQTIVTYETMIPMTFFSGDSDTQFHEKLDYVEQTIVDLPSSHSVFYSGGSTKQITIALAGTMAQCQKKKGEVNNEPATENTTENLDGYHSSAFSTGATKASWLATIAFALFL